MVLYGALLTLCGSLAVSGDAAMSGYAKENEMVTRLRAKCSLRPAHGLRADNHVFASYLKSLVFTLIASRCR